MVKFILNVGPNGGAQTLDLMLPKHALHQLSYIGIFYVYFTFLWSRESGYGPLTSIRLIAILLKLLPHKLNEIKAAGDVSALTN